MIDNKKQWFFLWFLVLWLTAAMILPFIAFCLTQNPISFTFFGTLAPPVYLIRPIIKHVFPMNDADLQIALAKAEAHSHKYSHKCARISLGVNLATTTNK